jgi:hypothetical protein
MAIRTYALCGVLALACAGPALSQTAIDPATTLPQSTTAPANEIKPVPGSPPPGVSDPMATNSTTGTVDHEDHCQSPGTAANSNPTADVATVPSTDAVCQ